MIVACGFDFFLSSAALHGEIRQKQKIEKVRGQRTEVAEQQPHKKTGGSGLVLH